MKTKRDDHLRAVTLVSAPWPLYNRPSIQLGTLKAYLKSRFPQLEVQALHLYLRLAGEIGYQIYHAISQRTWLAESIYGALLFPERKDKIKKTFQRESQKNAVLRDMDFEALVSQTENASQHLIQSADWNRCNLAGFSISQCQLTATLYFIKRIKKAFPLLPIAVGGSMFSGDHAAGLLKNFPEVDMVVNGEGERPLSEVIRLLAVSKDGPEGLSAPGVVTRKDMDKNSPVNFDQLGHLDSLPPPDYDDYFSVLKALPSDKAFFPTLPAEISRGCWWRSKTSSSAKGKGCAFCNLTLQWKGYRSKGVSQVVSEIDRLTSRYQTLSVAFTDNLLPPRQSKAIFLGLAKLGKDLRLFGEIRATTPLSVLHAMKDAGTAEVQIGIEALSTRLLRKLNKGTTAIQNLEILKHCEELDISSISNLILHFPGSDIEDVTETLHTLDFAYCFRPLRCVFFWLGLGSPVWQKPRSFGIKAFSNHRNYKALFASHIYNSMNFLIQSYRGDVGYQKKLWRPVRIKVRKWEKDYRTLQEGSSCSPVLSFRDGRDFVIIRQKRPKATTLTHRLVGTSRAIYLFCRRHRSLKRIVAHFPAAGEEKIVPFLKMMVDKRLMFEEQGRYLSLAVRVR